jgi:hypothetical protein
MYNIYVYIYNVLLYWLFYLAHHKLFRTENNISSTVSVSVINWGGI